VSPPSSIFRAVVGGSYGYWKLYACYVRSGCYGMQASQVTVGGLWIGITAGVLCGALYWAFAPALLARAGAQPAVVQHGISYLRYRALACPAILTLFVSFATFRGYKDTRCGLFGCIRFNVCTIVIEAGSWVSFLGVQSCDNQQTGLLCCSFDVNHIAYRTRVGHLHCRTASAVRCGLWSTPAPSIAALLKEHLVLS